MKILVVLLFLNITLFAQSSYLIYPSGVTQTEVVAVKAPYDNQTLFVSSNTINTSKGFTSEGIYVTTNGGISWRGSDTANGPIIQFHQSDPGIAITNNGTFILIRKGNSFAPGIFAHYSTNKGITWSYMNNITDEIIERPTVAYDPLNDRTYVTYEQKQFPYSVMFSYSTDNGMNWTSPAKINNSQERIQGAEIAIGLNGKIYICWAGIINTSPYTERYVSFASSDNLDASWNVKERILNINGIQGFLNNKFNIRVNGLPRIAVDTNVNSPRRGWIYIVTTQKNLSPAGSDPDLILYRSSDDGNTWSSGIRVNQDNLNNGKTQYFPAIHVDIYGGVNILYYDDRTTSNDSASVFISRSFDGGTTWKDIKISDRNFQPKPIGILGAGYQGDNITLISLDDVLFPFWMDDISGLYQVRTKPVNLSAVDVKDESNILKEYKLEQNYPNPFNPATTINFNLEKAGNVKLQIFDLLGNIVDVLIDEQLPEGQHSIKFNGNKLPSGTYFYKITAGNFTKTMKMVLLK